ncbi:MAG: hypothetical protein U1D96_10140 [Eubacteriales bacterium]|jgi:hypothetical protein|nr:hypothetical protein [Bacillota bacterium]MBV1727107.1 hypothetical protein [Desulforudis sp.]MDQ7789433.1 hypothetical protein [Clostridia bacterium]MDZ4043819.1 hypothetical protein [Eubacteriales bacterium]MBU4553557.1 hypothetical protein [Bacillota bacterium]
MFEIDSPIREEFFRWCDTTVLEHSKGDGTILKEWRPRKGDDGNYQLVFEIAAPGENTARHEVPIPDKYNRLLDEEYPSHDHEHEN